MTEKDAAELLAELSEKIKSAENAATALGCHDDERTERRKRVREAYKLAIAALNKTKG